MYIYRFDCKCFYKAFLSVVGIEVQKVCYVPVDDRLEQKILYHVFQVSTNHYWLSAD